VTVLEGRQLTKRFGQALALAGVDLAVASGEIVAVMGPSGSGKSTLLHVLSGIVPSDAGDVWFQGKSLDALSAEARVRLRRSSFGFVFQQGHLVNELPAVDNVMLPLLLDGVRRREARHRAIHWLERFRVAELANQRPGAMSGGQRQRVAIARALVTRPRVVFADEPTGALDTLTGERVMGALAEVAAVEGVAVVVVTHDARTAAHADREVVLRDGSIVTPAGRFR
jgi:putative ABC transport system ATP-binding protein